MLSVPHMIVVFLVVLVVFGPQKLPELARSFGKLMAEFRKASNDFRSAFEEEMRDLERQARVAELRKQAAEANAAADAAIKKSSEAGNAISDPAGIAIAETSINSESAEAPAASPIAGTVPRLDAGSPEADANADAAVEPATETPPSHDQQQPA